jgi:uncharacterized protein
MLLEFRVRNYRSFKVETVFSMVASKDDSLLRNVSDTGVSAVRRVNRSAVLYGANASGKTNLIRAMQLMRGVVVDSAALQPNQEFNVQQYLLDLISPTEPTMFEVTLLLDGVRYQYGFEFTKSRIVEEWLLVYQTAKPQVWFERKLDRASGEDVYKFGSNFVGPKAVWQNATRHNALFLSMAVQLNSKNLSDLHSWFAESFIVLLNGGDIGHDHSTQLLANKTGERRIVGLLNAADIGIKSIKTNTQKAQGFTMEFPSGASNIEEMEITLPKFIHSAGDVSAEFDLGDESQGTQKLYALAAPLFDILESGKVLVIDELDRSLHPLLVRQIIAAFSDPTQNCNGAQLLFTTHDTTQLDYTLLRRDQIFFVEKGSDDASVVVPLLEFSPRKGEALEKGYLSGRYGGVPILANHLVEMSNCA